MKVIIVILGIAVGGACGLFGTLGLPGVWIAGFATCFMLRQSERWF